MHVPKVTQHNKHIARVESVLLSVVYLLFRYKRAPGPAPSPVRRGGALRLLPRAWHWQGRRATWKRGAAT